MAAIVQGDRALIRRLGALKRGIARRIVSRASNKVIGPVAKAAKRNCPVDTGLLKKSIGKRTKTYRGSGAVVSVVGPRKGFAGQDAQGRQKDPTKYAHLAERKHGFLKAAWKAHESRLPPKEGAAIWAGIEREAAKG